EYTATCLFGLEKFLGEEIDALGYERVETIDGRVVFRGDIAAAARCSMWLRCAERLFIRLGVFRADSFTALFDGTRALPWENLIGARDAFPVKGHSIKSKLTSIPDCQSIVKKAVVERLRAAHKTQFLPEIGEKYQIEFFILNDMASLMIDTSGTPLHKRGYRPDAGEAPIRETLACALCKLARPREDVLFWDPMCGSGTIPIEAALLMSNTAPGTFRTFAAEKFPAIPKKAWSDAREEARSLVRTDCVFEAYATDIDPAAVAVTEENILRAGMGDYIMTARRDALTIDNEGRRGTIVTNPPYGERLLTPEQAEQLYRDMGVHFKALGAWQIYIITANENFERLYGRRADKVRKLYNGMIKCYYYQFFKQPK
ncbi:MAG: class I SAM-dependent RNA methyltransferase, partial [Eubacteriales bacterium]